jgi:hypothetical protein
MYLNSIIKDILRKDNVRRVKAEPRNHYVCLSRVMGTRSICNYGCR